MPQKTNFACDEREPLFEKRGCKWHFFSKKVCYVVILHYLCIRKRGREVASFGFVLGSLWVRSGFALPSLWVRSGFAPKSGGKEKPKRDEIDLDVV